MRTRIRRVAVLCLALFAVTPGIALAGGVEALFDLSSPSTSPFPSDRFTAPDGSHLTRLRVSLPKPDCAVRPSDCADIDVINTLDGFNLQPRPPSRSRARSTVATVNSSNVFLFSVGDARGGSGPARYRHQPGRVGPGDLHAARRVGRAPRPAHALRAHRHQRHPRHARPSRRGEPSVPSASSTSASSGTPRFRPIRPSCSSPFEAPGAGPPRGGRQRLHHPERHRRAREDPRQIKADVPDPATSCSARPASRTVFPLASAGTAVPRRQLATAPSSTVSPAPWPCSACRAPSAARVRQVHLAGLRDGRRSSSRPSAPAPACRPSSASTTSTSTCSCRPARRRPAAGRWRSSVTASPTARTTAPSPSPRPWRAGGIATIAINVVGHGGGPLGTLTVTATGVPRSPCPAGGRGIDQNGNGPDRFHGGPTAAPPRGIIGSRDGLRQTVVDLMQLVRVIQGGVDVDGDGVADLDGSRIYYFGQSFGGIYGTIFLAVEPTCAPACRTCPAARSSRSRA